MDPAFLEFCNSIGVEANDERYLFWVAGRHVDEPPVAWAVLDADGGILSMLDAIPPGIRPRPIPLYRRPVSKHRPPVPSSVIAYVWKNYSPDIEGFARWLEQYLRGE